jgi:predicted amidohydrolase YtcJ
MGRFGVWVAALLGVAALARGAERPADVIFANGNVLTLEDARPRASAIAVRAGRIVAVGGEADVRPFRGATTRRVDLKGQTVLPGLTDAHVHVEGIGTALESLDLVGASTLDEALSRVRAGADAAPAGEWVLGRGWDQNDWPDRTFPTAAALDAVSGDHPVYLTRVDGHAGWANSRALALAGITAQTPDPPGGRILRDAQGAASGVFVDTAQDLVRKQIPPPTREARKRRLAAGLRAAAAAGLYKELLGEAPLPTRVYVMIRGPEEFLSRGASLKPEIGLGDGQLTIRAIKVVADGALGSRGAWLLAPYSDEPGKTGLRTVDPDAFRELLRRALAQGFQVNTHAIGDAANRFVLDAYEAAFAAAGGKPGGSHRFRIEHAQVIAPGDVPRFKALGVIPSMQPTHCTSDMPWATDRLGPERAKGAYLWKTFLRQGVPVPGGSDAPVESVAVVPGLHAAVTRQDAKGWPEGGWHPEERVTPLEAVRMFARDGAYAAFEESARGTIAAGKRADFTVLDRDVTKIPPAEILSARVTLVVVGGRFVHEAR